ncbi:glycoside hydrolase family 13 protein [Zafaria sp. Z1313]|uniref:glycoside hydrolase family 13 protein n=1 Tax=unclassified Zafaria TaxID=2828765 RepID=UPI002E7704A8|nr:glycoside hydrolase family 13 protein [Zafaria sp. J156]MEE1622419.1 glycoside hydrolase family 13 protein [Zafaria sp. J156]
MSSSCGLAAPAGSATPGPLLHVPSGTSEWWRRAVIYQVYPRSFRDTTGNGIGDLPGITRELHHLAGLGVDAVWLSPFFRSPQRDAGYDVSDYCDVDPLFGTLADFDALIARADALGVRIIVDLVPNHCSDQHALFQAALAAAPGAPERELFVFRDGSGPDGSAPPNNWQSHFGGSAWTRTAGADGAPGQWYLHLFDSSQPDFNWDNPAVHAEFERILRFWLDRGAGGFRVDVAHALVKEPGLPDWGGSPDGYPVEGYPFADAPMFGREGVHAVFRRWREVLEEYPGERILCAEANVHPVEAMADWVRPDEMHQAFNFPYLGTGWDAAALKAVTERSLRAFDAVGAPTTWVLSNHDVARHTTRFGTVGVETRVGDGLGPDDPQPDEDLGLRRARAATLFTLGLPGGVYLYQGEELGLPDHTLLPHEFRQDPTFHRTGGQRTGRDGCRVPLPWTTAGGAFGFSDAGASWLPQPGSWARYARDAQDGAPGSTLEFYRAALALRRAEDLGLGSLAWLDGPGSAAAADSGAPASGTTAADSTAPSTPASGLVAYANGGIGVVLNAGAEAAALPAGADVLLESFPGSVEVRGQAAFLAPDAAVWLRLPGGTAHSRSVGSPDGPQGAGPVTRTTPDAGPGAEG